MSSTEETGFTKPGAAVAAGRCGSCLGTGRVNRVIPYDDVFPCSTCGGDGLHPPRCADCGLRHMSVEAFEACAARQR